MQVPKKWYDEREAKTSGLMLIETKLGFTLNQA
jgi:hypothetical protein